MPSFITHPAVPLAMGLALGRNTAPPALIATGVAVAILPDLDMLTYYIGIPLSHEYGHRGFSHSILFAGLVAIIGAYLLRAYRIPWPVATGFLFISTLSHGVLDAFTNGGHGIAFLWPWAKTRYFSPYRVIQVSPIHLERILSYRIPVVLLSEILWVWLPLALMGMLGVITRICLARIQIHRPQMHCVKETHRIDLTLYKNSHKYLMVRSEEERIDR